MEWTPTIIDRHGPLFRRIADALSDDIAQGRLRRGQQLPTHRALARALDIDLSTVTHAYREARSRGLIEARVGQGTFVAESLAQARTAHSPWATFDLAMNLPPQPLDADIEGRITRGIAALARETGLGTYLNYREPGGLDDERNAAVTWLSPRIANAEASRLLICPGTQCALSVLLGHLTSPGDTVLTERLTYPGIKAAAAAAGVALAGVETDDHGILPDALEQAIRHHKPKALYLIPTMHNPTTVTMPLGRREAVAEILRSSGLNLIEDDAYGAFEPEAQPFAALVPELTFCASTMSKCLAPGLRVAFLLAPDAAIAEILSERLRAIVQMSPPLMVALVTRWIRDGGAAAITASIAAEAASRQNLAAAILSPDSFAARPNSLHLWLPLPRRWSPAEFVAHVRRQGLAIVGSDAFAVGPGAPNAVRVALGAAASRHELGAALNLIAAALKSGPQAKAVV